MAEKFSSISEEIRYWRGKNIPYSQAVAKAVINHVRQNNIASTDIAGAILERNTLGPVDAATYQLIKNTAEYISGKSIPKNVDAFSKEAGLVSLAILREQGVTAIKQARDMKKNWSKLDRNTFDTLFEVSSRFGQHADTRQEFIRQAAWALAESYVDPRSGNPVRETGGKTPAFGAFHFFPETFVDRFTDTEKEQLAHDPSIKPYLDKAQEIINKREDLLQDTRVEYNRTIMKASSEQEKTKLRMGLVKAEKDIIRQYVKDAEIFSKEMLDKDPYKLAQAQAIIVAHNPEYAAHMLGDAGLRQLKASIATGANGRLTIKDLAARSENPIPKDKIPAYLADPNNNSLAFLSDKMRAAALSNRHHFFRCEGNDCYPKTASETLKSINDSILKRVELLQQEHPLIHLSGDKAQETIRNALRNEGLAPAEQELPASPAKAPLPANKHNAKTPTVVKVSAPNAN